jgi:hypothetical protein
MAKLAVFFMRTAFLKSKYPIIIFFPSTTRGYIVGSCPSRNGIFSLSSRRAKILTTGIYLIFRGLKFSPNTEIGENSHFRMDTISGGGKLVPAKQKGLLKAKPYKSIRGRQQPVWRTRIC